MTTYVSALIQSFRSDEEGQGLAEYGLILGLIAMIAITAVMFLGSSMNSMFSKLGNSI